MWEQNVRLQTVQLFPSSLSLCESMASDPAAPNTGRRKLNQRNWKDSSVQPG